MTLLALSRALSSPAAQPPARRSTATAFSVPLAAALLMLAALPARVAHAQVAAPAAPAMTAAAPATSAGAPMPTPADPALYRAFGERPGLVKLMDDFMVRLLADPRTAPHFKEVKQDKLKTQLVDQFCQVSGGPCAYKGADMKTAHGNLDIRKSDFHALVEVLQQSMDAQGIPFRAQNELLAKLAPMHREVITVR
jgi:hemoglobin